MSLSTKTFNTLANGLTNKAAANELVALVNARSGTPSRTLSQCMIDGMTDQKTGREVLAALTSGANLSLNARRRLLTMMDGDGTAAGYSHAAGNELINFIQATPQTTNTTL